MFQLLQTNPRDALRHAHPHCVVHNGGRSLW